MKKRILIVEDEQKIMRFIRANFIVGNYEVYTAEDGREALNMYERFLPDVILLDVMLPIIDGYEVLTEIRKYSDVPIIMITAKSGSTDAIKGLELGADDYIAKPFDINELLARVRAVLRRTKKEKIEQVNNLNLGVLNINLAKYTVKKNDKEIKLTPTEFKIFVELVKNLECVLTHESLLCKVWGVEYREETHYLRVCIARIRQKLGISEGTQGYIQTIPTVGYKMVGESVKTPK